jgi:hypothetical protein
MEWKINNLEIISFVRTVRLTVLFLLANILGIRNIKRRYIEMDYFISRFLQYITDKQPIITWKK